MELKQLLIIFVSFLLVVAASMKILPLEFPEIPSNEIFFNCLDNKFIGKELVCDGEEDCSNGADEEFCYEHWEGNQQMMTTSLTFSSSTCKSNVLIKTESYCEANKIFFSFPPQLKLFAFWICQPAWTFISCKLVSHSFLSHSTREGVSR